MIFDFLKKQKKAKQQKKLTQIMILNLDISDEQKKLYLEALDVLSDDEISELYKNWTNFVNKLEIKEIEDIQKWNFASIAWLRKKEAKEKKKEINTFNFLFNNI